PGLYRADFAGGCGFGSSRFAPERSAPQGAGHGSWFAVNAGVPVTGLKTVLHQGGDITGVVTGTHGRRLSQVCVSAVNPADPSAPQTETIPVSWHGTYRVTGLAAGRYAVQFAPCNGQPYATQWYKSKPAIRSATLVSVRAGHTVGHIDARLTSGATITGQV